jgi:hypothetical protein
MKKYKIRTGTKEDIIALCGALPPYATRSWAAEVDGELAAVAGVQFTPTNAVVFSDINTELDLPKMTIWRGAVEMFNKIKELKRPLVAVCTDNYMNSPAFLERLGFEFHGNSEEGEVLTWRP